MNQPCRRQTAAGRVSGNLMTKVTVYFRTIRSGFNTWILLSITLVFRVIKSIILSSGAKRIRQNSNTVQIKNTFMQKCRECGTPEDL